MEKKVEELKKASPEKQAELAHIMNHNAQRAQMNQKALNPQMGGALTNLFGFGGPNLMAQPQPNMMASFMPMIPGFQPTFNPNPMQALVIKGGRASSIPLNPYPQYQNQARPIFGATGAQVGMSPPRVQPQPQVQMVPQHPPPQAINLSNPLAMMNMGRQQNNSSNPLQGFGLGNNNHHRSRRF